MNGTQVLSANDSVLAIGSPGVFVQTNAGGTSDVQIDDWVGGIAIAPRLSVVPRIPVGRQAILDEYGVIIRDDVNRPLLEETFLGYRIPVGGIGLTDAEGRLILDEAGYPLLDEATNGPRLPRS